MAQKSTEFFYSKIELYKSESLGSGSYGGVCKAKCDGLVCAAKIMHPTLFDLRDPGTATYLQKFKEECHLLSLARHPNVVQYLATYTDPDTRLPVLLMELCDESLTSFLERSPGPLPYHIQVNICHNIALALVYLHSNGLIHRDLTANNVLMIAGPRAKVTDFGMSKLATVNPRMTALTLCPGNILYMSPEALDDAKSYTAKLDVFSFGVIVIQILTRKFPNPTRRFHLLSSKDDDEESGEDQDERSEVRRLVPETERRQSHLKLIPDTHPLKPLAIQCLKTEKRRPSAVLLSDQLSELKHSYQYIASVKQMQSSSSDVEQLHLQLRGQRILTEAKTTEVGIHKARIAELEKLIEEREKLQIDQQSQLQQRLQEREQTISFLKQTLTAYERKIQKPEQGLAANGEKEQKQPVTTPAAGAQKDTSKMRLRKGKNAPEPIHRGAAVAHGNTAYFTPANSHKVYSYQNSQGKEKWSQLPDNHNENCGLAIIDGLLTSVGGWNISPTNALLCLRGEREEGGWFATLPPMPTPRNNAACVTTQQVLVVAGGFGAGVSLDAVEIMDIGIKQWTRAPSLPERLSLFTAAICRDTLYLAGGFTGLFSSSKSVFACTLTELLPSTASAEPTGKSHTQQNVWKEIDSLPVTRSTVVSFGDDLLAIGGNDKSDKPTSDIYRYDADGDTWSYISRMNHKRSWCFAFTDSNNHLIVAGGYTLASTETESVEIFEQ